MRKIVVLCMISLDGVMQGPGAPKEDSSGGFKHGGWVAPFEEEAYDEVVRKELQPADYLLGRKTFEIWANYWPQHAEYWPGINEGTKYVFSKKMKKKDPLVTGWKNSVVIKTVGDIRRIKAEPAGKRTATSNEIQVWGSSELVPLLLKHDLVDELRLKIHPITLGKGKKLLGNGTMPAAFTLVDTIVTPKGVIIAHYKRAGKVETGTVAE